MKEGVKRGERKERSKAITTGVSYQTSRSAPHLQCENSPSLQPLGRLYLAVGGVKGRHHREGIFKDRVSFLNTFSGVFFYHHLVIYPES